jgi:hypothetical protein|tara:strand:+ start:1579 stop:2109 length:531 start_codon:yes stop_codon:yes gene_type:complete
MFEFSEIQPGDLIRVLVNFDDLDDDAYALVEEHCDDYLIVKYYSETTCTYKGAEVYTLDEDTNILREESVSEHFPGKENIFTCVSENDRMYVIETEQDSDIESELCVESDETGSDVGSFVVSDGEFEGRLDLPPDAAAVDRAWNEWTPSSPGSSRFKEAVDRIEERARLQMDNINF